MPSVLRSYPLALRLFMASLLTLLCTALPVPMAWAQAAAQPAAAAVSGDPIVVPPLTGRVIDQTGTLTAEQIKQLSDKLAAFEAEKGSQIAVLIVPTTRPEAIEQFSIRVVDAWKLGRKKVDDGILLLIAKNDRALRIEVGYGLEGAVTDINSQRIIREMIVPQFKQNEYFAGVVAGIDALMGLIRGEPLPAPSSTQQGSDSDLEAYSPIAIIAALVMGGILKSILGRTVGSMATGGIVGLAVWFLSGTLWMASLLGMVVFVFSLLGRSIGMGNGIQIGSGGFGGGSGSGGFSGGGGGFGGGGSSGNW